MSGNNEFTQEKLDLEKNKHIRFAQSSISSKSVGETALSRSGVSYDQLQMALQDPYSNIGMIQQISKILYHTNGVYYRLIEMFANTPLYDLYLSPTAILGFNGKNNAVDKMNKEYEQIAQLVEKTNYKYNFKEKALDKYSSKFEDFKEAVFTVYNQYKNK